MYPAYLCLVYSLFVLLAAANSECFPNLASLLGLQAEGLTQQSQWDIESPNLFPRSCSTGPIMNQITAASAMREHCHVETVVKTCDWI